MMTTPNVTHKRRITVSLSDDVMVALNNAIESHEFDNYSQAVRKAVRTAMIEK